MHPAIHEITDILLGASVRSIRFAARILGYISSRVTLERLKKQYSQLPCQALGTSGNAKGLFNEQYVWCLPCVFTSSVQSFVIAICNEMSYENGLHNVCLKHQLSRTFSILFLLAINVNFAFQNLNNKTKSGKPL